MKNNPEVKPSQLIDKWVMPSMLESMEDNLCEIDETGWYERVELTKEKQKELELLIKDFMDKNATIS